MQSIGKPQLSFWYCLQLHFLEGRASKRKKGKLGLLAEVRGEGSEGVLEVKPVTWSVYMLIKAKNAQKLQYYLITGPKLVGGEASAKSPSIIFF